jgi:hypothetical protein
MLDHLQRARPDLMTMRATIARLPACLLMLALVAYTVSSCTNRMVLVEGEVLLVLLLPILWACAVPWRRLDDGVAGWYIATALALGAWMAGVQLLRPDALPAGWWVFAVRAASLCTVVLLLARGADARELLRLGGCAAACALSVCAVMNAHMGVMQPLDTNSFGFGHVNILVNTAGPALVAAIILMMADWRAGARPGMREAILLGCGLISLLAIIIYTQRRGVLLSSGAACATLVVAWLWSRRRALALTVVVVVVVAAGLYTIRQFAVATPGLRGERIQLYRSGMEGVAAGLPWGFGHYGALHLQTIEGEASRHMTANGGYGEDVHNQLLEAALDGGPVALLLLLAGLALVGWRLLTISDAALRLALQALGVAVAVHLATDNVYGTEVGTMWLGLVVGTMLTAPAAGPRLPALRWLPPLPLLAWPLCAVAAWGAAIDLRPAAQPQESGLAESYRCLQQALNPQAVSLYADKLLSSEDPWMDLARRDEVLRRSSQVMGWTIRTAMFEADRAQRAGDPGRTVEAVLRVLALMPFFREYYEQLDVVVRQHPQCERLLPQQVRQRLAYLGGDPRLPRPDLQRIPHTVAEAADFYAALSWSIANGRPWAELDAPLRQLALRYGDIQGVAQLVVMAVCAAPEVTFAWLGDAAPVLGVAMRTSGASLKAFGLATTPAQARALLPLVERLYPTILADCRAGTRHATDDPQTIAYQLTIVRLWGLSRRAAPAGAPR